LCVKIVAARLMTWLVRACMCVRIKLSTWRFHD